jgi:HSP20 family protein
MARNPLTPSRSGSRPGGDPFLSLHREMNRLFDDVLRGVGLPAAGGQTGGTNLFAPQRDVSETDNEIRITAELPSVNETDIQVERNDDILVIRGEKKFERQDEKERSHFVERSYGTFQRAPAPLPGGSGSGAGELRKRRSHRYPAQERSSRAVAPHSSAGRTRPEWGGRPSTRAGSAGSETQVSGGEGSGTSRKRKSSGRGRKGSSGGANP